MTDAPRVERTATFTVPHGGITPHELIGLIEKGSAGFQDARVTFKSYQGGQLDPGYVTVTIRETTR